MTHATTLFTRAPHPDPDTIFGPYSPWAPRPRRFGPQAAIAGAIGTLAVFFHCVIPMIA